MFRNFNRGCWINKLWIHSKAHNYAIAHIVPMALDVPSVKSVVGIRMCCQTVFKFQYRHRWHEHRVYVNKYLSCSNKLLSIHFGRSFFISLFFFTLFIFLFVFFLLRFSLFPSCGLCFRLYSLVFNWLLANIGTYHLPICECWMTHLTIKLANERIKACHTKLDVSLLLLL